LRRAIMTLRMPQQREWVIELNNNYLWQEECITALCIYHVKPDEGNY